jgi:hypothetical protein
MLAASRAVLAVCFDLKDGGSTFLQNDGVRLLDYIVILPFIVSCVETSNPY